MIDRRLHRTLKLPWEGEYVPHALLDVIRGCNITCRACYNTAPERAKPLEKIREELDILCRRRRLDSVAIIGGEPTLHPNLCKIVRMIKARDIHVEIFTNGLLAEGELLAELHAAGADMVFLHIDAHQDRPELPPERTVNDLRNLWKKKAAAVAAAGMSVGLAVTAYPDAVADIDEAMRFVLTSPPCRLPVGDSPS